MDSAVAGNVTETVDATNQQHESDLAADLLAVVAQLDRFASQRIQMDLTAAQARMLATIEAHADARICQLAAMDHCAQPTMTLQLRRFEEAGLVARVLDPSDARAARIRITDKGIRTLGAVRADLAAAIEPRLALLGPADRQLLATAVNVLRRFVDVPVDAPHRKTRRSDRS